VRAEPAVPTGQHEFVLLLGGILLGLTYFGALAVLHR